MSDFTTPIKEHGATIGPRGRVRMIAAVVGGALAAFFALYAVGYYLALHSRYPVAGKTDPITRYRIEYTVSSRYSRTESEKFDSPWVPGIAYSFSPRPPPQALKWMYTHILRQPSHVVSSNWNGWATGAIKQYVFKNAADAGVKIDAQGYPDLSAIRGMGTNFVQNHVLVSGNPATWCSFRIQMPATVRIQLYSLILKAQNLPRIYVFAALDDMAVPTGAESEIMRIKDTIHFVKVK